MIMFGSSLTSTTTMRRLSSRMSRPALRAAAASFSASAGAAPAPRTGAGGGRGMCSDAGRRMNENNMTSHHVNYEQPTQEWTMYEGKIPVLKKSSKSGAQQQQQPRYQHKHHEDHGTVYVDDLLNERFATTAARASSSAVYDKSFVASANGTTSSSSSHSSSAVEEWKSYGESPRTSLLMELTDKVGVLQEVLRHFWKYDVNICRIESRPIHPGASGKRRFDFFVDMEGSVDDDNVQKLLSVLQPMTHKLLVLDEKSVRWFPRHISELDFIADRTLDAGVDLIAEDHPGFHDKVYRKRREELAENAMNYTYDQEIPIIEYSREETAVWGAVWDRMESLWDKYACKEYLHNLELMKRECGYGRDRIPQQRDISNFLYNRTEFKMRPVAGLLSSRDFLNGLAFRVFFSTQYIRHHSKPLYTPEPDICHELLGHAPMFANRDFADFSQQIGLASLGASDDDIDRLAHCYWHSVEFGLCVEDGRHKAYGAGLLSSFGELEYACSPEHPGADAPPEIIPWDPETASKQEFPITTYQPVYFLAQSLQDAKDKMRQYCEDLPRPFFALYNSQNQNVHIDRPVRRNKGDVPGPNVE